MIETTHHAVNKAFPDKYRRIQVVYVVRHNIGDAFEGRFFIPHFLNSTVDFKKFGGLSMFDLFFELADVLGAQ